MQKIHIAISIISIGAVFLMISSCNAQERYHPGGPYYYRSFSDYNIPFRPVKEINPEEAKNLDSYYIAHFDNDGKIISFKKYLYGKLEFSDKYIYKSDGLLDRRELTKATGEITIQYFDKNGKIIKNRK